MNRTRTPVPKPVHARGAVGARQTGLKLDPEQPDLLSTLFDILSTESGAENVPFPTLRYTDSKGEK